MLSITPKTCCHICLVVLIDAQLVEPDMHTLVMGRDNQGGFRAWATKHTGWEQFDARRHPDGGYQLLSIHWWNRSRMAVDMKTQRVVEIAGPGDTLGAAARWDFVQIE